MKTYVVLLRGPPGVGKSSVAVYLSKVLPPPVFVIHKDDLHYHFPHRGKVPANELITAMVPVLLRKGMSVIIDGVYGGKNSVSRISTLVRIARTNKARFAVIFLHADNKTCLQRNNARTKKIPLKEMRKWYDYVYVAPIQKGIKVNTVGKSQKQTFNEVRRLLKASGI